MIDMNNLRNSLDYNVKARREEKAVSAESSSSDEGLSG